VGYTFTWDDIEKICEALGLRKINSNVWQGVGPDGINRTCTIHSKHKGNIGDGLTNAIAKHQLFFKSKKDMYNFLKNL